MKLPLWVGVILFLVVTSLPANAANYYFAATSQGSGTGADCADALAYGNGTTTGISSATYQVPGNTLHLCGTITGSAGATAVTLNASGSSGSPITIKFETNAVLTAPYWGCVCSGVQAAIVSSQSFITIDGGANGVIENTQNGAGLTYLAASFGFFADGPSLSHITIKNLTFSNFCVETVVANTECSTMGTNDSAIFMENGFTNVSITDNSINDTTVGITYSNLSSDTAVSIDHNTITRTNWGINIGSGTTSNLIIHDNDISCVTGTACNWGPVNHHNGIMIDTQSGAQTGILIYNNYIHDVNPSSSYINFDPGSSSLISGTYVFNNVLFTTTGQSGPQDGAIATLVGAGISAYNNTIVGPGNAGIYILTSSGAKNNIVQSAVYGELLPTGYASISSDYNDFYNLVGDGGGSIMAAEPSFYATVASWTSGTGFDTHSIITNPLLTGSFLLTLGSPAIQSGTNLTSTCSTVPALCMDRAGNPRPSSGSWDMGAYQYVNPAPAPAATMFVRAQLQ